MAQKGSVCLKSRRNRSCRRAKRHARCPLYARAMVVAALVRRARSWASARWAGRRAWMYVAKCAAATAVAHSFRRSSAC